MKDDFTRDTFDATKHFSRVLAQQGRVTLDSDQNEQTSIVLHLLRTMARDILGPYAVPVDGGGFNLTGAGGLTITAGRFYVDGILVENENDCLYSAQPDYPLPANDPVSAELQKSTGTSFWFYLDVWERNITWIEDDSIREKALNGVDTCARSKVVWQVKAIPASSANSTSQQAAVLKAKLAALQQQAAKTTDPAASANLKNEISAVQQAIARLGKDQTHPILTCGGPLSALSGLSDAMMTAQLDPGLQIQDPCILSPESQYRGAENQLYRVEIHTGGSAGTASFKWSRDNGSRATTWLGTSGNDLQVGSTRGFESGMWVELSDDVLDLQGLPGVFVKLAKVDGGVLSVDASTVTASSPIAWTTELMNPRVRRWDQQASDAQQLSNGAIPLTESTPDNPAWIDLEDGIRVMFAPGGTYRSGDYWLIPARVATGQIEWPTVPGANGTAVNAPLSPRGIEHHYAPLGIVGWVDGEFRLRSCRCEFAPVNRCYASGSIAVGSELLTERQLAPAGLKPAAARAKRQPGKKAGPKP